MEGFQKWLVILGLALVIVGLAWPWLRHLPLGRLPGDILIQRENFVFYFPITTMILISAVLTLLFWIFRR
ncbi:MAG TPA: DUF2905 domain-containing protein [Chromatiales bacterium]|nr:DUF2905 domain-containing protein [Chromatiales bacterium]